MRENNNMNDIIIDPSLKLLASTIKEHGGNLYIVGGYVRNSYLCLSMTDIDICGDLTYDKVLELANSIGFDAHIVNKKLGTVLIKTEDNEYEYTTFRKENYVEGGAHSPTDVNFVNDIKLDASRRDFTANSLYYDINSGEIIDFYGGIHDIAKRKLKTIKTPAEVFSSDGLRILRMVRIANELGFEIDSKTRRTAREYCSQIADISAERILKELKKIVVSDLKYDNIKSKENFFDNFNYLGIYRYIFNNNFANFKISKKYQKEFFALPKNFRYVGYWMLWLANYFGFRYIAPAQVHWTAMTYLGNSGLKESNNNIETIVTAYNIFQEIAMNNKQNYRHILMDFYNASSEVKKFIEAFIPNAYREIRQDIKILQLRNIPLCSEELKVSNVDLINIAKIDKRMTSKIRMHLLISALNEDISNSRQTLLIQAKYLNIKLLSNPILSKQKSKVK